jgi:hypothetical protein
MGGWFTQYGERVVVQLVHVIWFPERPAQGVLDVGGKRRRPRSPRSASSDGKTPLARAQRSPSRTTLPSLTTPKTTLAAPIAS